MITITLNNIQTLNNSLQVGDMVYATGTTTQSGSYNAENAGPSPTVGLTELVGILRRITFTNYNISTGSYDIILDVDETPFVGPYTPVSGDFIMFSKYSQTDGDVNGYYAEVKFKNNSIEKAELFSIGSEVIINSK